VCVCVCVCVCVHTDGAAWRLNDEGISELNFVDGLVRFNIKGLEMLAGEAAARCFETRLLVLRSIKGLLRVY
jgi:hypothetical protein